MAGRTHRADRHRKRDSYPDERDDHREHDTQPDDDYDEDGYEEQDEYDEDTYDEEDGAAARPISAPDAARYGARHIAGLTGKPVSGVTSLDRTERGWVVGVEVVEDARVPSSADILAIYRTELDTLGELTGYRRTRRYPRGRGDNGTGMG